MRKAAGDSTWVAPMESMRRLSDSLNWVMTPTNWKDDLPTPVPDLAVAAAVPDPPAEPMHESE